MVARASRPALPRRPARPARRDAGLPPVPEPPKPDDLHGGLGPWADDLPTRSREYILRAYRYFRLNPLLPPTQTHLGTVPEVVMIGGLLARDFAYNGTGPGSFSIQSPEMGGRRVPGGAVVDLVVEVGGAHVGVRVQGYFHGLSFAFGGAAKVAEDEVQRVRLAANGYFTRVVDVNRDDHGRPLEMGPNLLVDREFDRVLGRY